MTTWRQKAIEAGMELFCATGAHRLAESYTRGLGALLMFHRVRPRLEQRFEPNQPLEIAPGFLDQLLGHVRDNGYDVVSLDEATDILRAGVAPKRPFVALTFDDGYRDLAEYALPVLEKRGAPFTAYVTTGFAAGEARLWWVDLEEAIRRLEEFDVVVAGKRLQRSCRDGGEKAESFEAIYWALRAASEDELYRVVTALCAEAGVEPRRLTASLCLDWAGVEALAGSKLATIGAHSVTHPRLARLDVDSATREMRDSRDELERRLQRPVRHFCYPYGDATSAGKREFDLARDLGFDSAVTTRPGVLFPEHGAHLHALPRLSVNGKYQTLDAFDVLLSGAAFAVMNYGRRVAAA
jgi:peptidoglycan/xylan/chitin deacetylase (PgdA/CDA1 family)